MFREMSTYVFFVLTGYKFRAAAANPYFTLTNDETTHADEDDEMDVVWVSTCIWHCFVLSSLEKPLIIVSRNGISIPFSFKHFRLAPLAILYSCQF